MNLLFINISLEINGNILNTIIIIIYLYIYI
jgi:hypothetical protein